MDIFNTLALITKPDHVELPAEATLEAIETLTELDYCPNCGSASAYRDWETLTHD